ncbi:hypothetical protein PLICRDRAFT_88186 [Plicaturopsis crispa FD-325 SS-3]|nr:hypothetical protein PLICRDRAFT_88186 [Plicaturopsis crispa FD-325 SS-3]
MANVVHPPIDFHHGSITNTKSPLGFGFGLSSTPSNMAAAGWPSTPGHTQPSAFHQLASTMNQSASPMRVQKRRHEPEDEGENRHLHGLRDDAMDRSPTPERPQRAAPKRARVAPTLLAGPADEKTGKENKAPSGNDDNDVDVGVLLATLPQESLLPLLNNLLQTHPGLKSLILPFIPRPTVDAAKQALRQANDKLKNSYPYTKVTNAPTISAGFGGFGSARTSAGFGSSSMGFLQAAPPQSLFGQPSPGPKGHTDGMRDEYIISRIRPHVTAFVATCMSYLPYFSFLATSDTNPSTQQSSTHSPTHHSTAHQIQSQHRDKLYPTETYEVLNALTEYYVSQQPLTRSLLGPLLLPRLVDEWRAWLDRVDYLANTEMRLFGAAEVQRWVQSLNNFAAAVKGPDGTLVMREVRDGFMYRCSILHGNSVHPMEEGF